MLLQYNAYVWLFAWIRACERGETRIWEEATFKKPLNAAPRTLPPKTPSEASTMSASVVRRLAALSGASAVGLGAYGAHGKDSPCSNLPCTGLSSPGTLSQDWRGKPAWKYFKWPLTITNLRLKRVHFNIDLILATAASREKKKTQVPPVFHVLCVNSALTSVTKLHAGNVN